MSYFHPGSTSIDDYPQSGKPVEGGWRREDPPQRDKIRHQNGQQQAFPVGVLPPGHHLPRNNNPDMQSSHESSHQHQLQQQSTLPEISTLPGYPQKHDYPESQQTTYNSLQPASVDVSDYCLPGYQSPHQHPQHSQGYHSKLNDCSNHQSPNQSHQPVLSILVPSQPQNFPVKDQPKPPAVQPEEDPKFDQQTNSQNLQKLTKSNKQKPDSQPQQPEGTEPSREPLPAPPPPPGYPPHRPPTAPHKLEPQPKKGLLKKIFCCFFR